MLKPIHAEITRRALGDRFGADALEAIVRANLGQDGLAGQLRPEFHFDDNAFEQGRAYIAAQREAAVIALREGRAADAWAAFGRLTHAAQDFFAHSNYVALWLDSRGAAAQPAPDEIDAADPALLASPRLRSGVIYYPTEVLYFIPGLRRLALRMLPHDSHAHMNLDSAAQGPHFPYAFAAAVQRTLMEYESLIAELPPGALELFTGEGPASLQFGFADAESIANPVRSLSHAMLFKL